MIEVKEHPVEAAVYACTPMPRAGCKIVAVSGGADSMALIEALRPLRRSPEHRLVVAHFDHKLRDDSARDAEHVAAYGRTHDLEFVLGSGDVVRRARATKRSIEEAARDARYEFLAATAARFRSDCVLTAHTRDDVVETVLMRILRGTGRYGLAGIPGRRDIFYRLLLGVTHRETVDYCATRGVGFVEDPTNADTTFFRNRVRHEILPQLRAVYPGIDEGLWRMATTARDENEEFAGSADEWFRSNVVVEKEGTITIAIDGFRRGEEGAVARFLHAACVRLGLARDVGLVHYHRLAELTRDDQIGSSADLPGFSARREHDALVLARTRGAAAPVNCTRIVVPSCVHIGDWSLEAGFVSVDDARRAIAAGEAGTDVAYFDADAVGDALLARAPRPGDRMRPFGLAGHKKLSDLFIDRKVPRRARERAILIEGEAIHWVPGVATGDESRVGPGTARVIRLKATRT